MNYCVLNGVKSNTVKGLLIQSLPPISKPLIRTEIEEVDGRDGDVVTVLGYSAYDKEMTIGLFGDYDVDDVISYFDSQGTVTFSNEPDKYYNYKIIEQIDFERLVRFKTATVKFHIQPFKYSAVDKVIELGYPVDIPDGDMSKNGITVTTENDVINVSGTASEATELLIPTKALTLEAGDYILSSTATGNADGCSVRLTKSGSPSSADSLGGSYITLMSNANATLEAELTAVNTYDCIWLYVAKDSNVNFALDLSVMAEGSESYKVINRGNTKAKPKLTIHGADTVIISINDAQVLSVDIGDMGYITIDSAGMNAYKGDKYMNRHVVGDYDDVCLKVGTNVITWTGVVSKIVMEDCSRWI